MRVQRIIERQCLPKRTGKSIKQKFSPSVSIKPVFHHS
jgi:hypothetical protein